MDHIETIMRRDLQIRTPLPTQFQDFQAQARLESTEGIHHISAINPFRFHPASEVKQLLSTFIQRVNSIFYFFRKGELENYFDMVAETTSSFPNQIMCELCLALALGAQASNSENADKTIMWYENGRRYLDDDNWKNKLWVMRAVTLISIFHIEERRDTSYHYLSQFSLLSGNLLELSVAGIAISIGQANLLDRGTPHKQSDEETLQWLHVWRTVRFLHKFGLPFITCRLSLMLYQVAQIV